MIVVHGLLGVPSPRLREDATAASWVVGGRRHLDALEVDDARRIVLGSVADAAARLAGLPDEDLAVVVASGDPLFFGVVRTLRAAGLRPRVVPAPSSIAAAFAAVGVPWDDATVVSAHGRPIETALRLARALPKVAVFTSPAHGVRELAAGLKGAGRWFVLAERLGEPDERVRVLSAAEAARVEPAEPNVVLILDRHPDEPDEPWDGLVAGPSVPESGAPAGDADAPVIGQVTSGPASLERAAAIDAVLGAGTRRYPGGAAAGLVRAWGECDLIVSHLALGATARILAPLLADKRTDPGVVVVDEAGRFAIPLVGGHAGGANGLASRIAEGLGATAVLTTATDATGVPGLDTLGWPASGDVAAVTRAILDGRPVEVTRSHAWPLLALPANVAVRAPGEPSADAGCPLVRVSDEAALPDASRPTVVLRPPSLVAGLGCNRGTPAAALRALLDATLAEAGLAAESLAALVSVDAKADEPGLAELAAALGVPLVTYPADALAAIDVPHPSPYPAAAVGTPSVAEASVLARGAELVVPKRKSAEATCAIGRLPARGRLALVGLGPGAPDLLTPRALAALRDASHVVGYRPYLTRIAHLLRPGTQLVKGVMGREEERIEAAIGLARAGRSVALVSSGDAGVYGMASPALEVGVEGIDVTVVPGVTASLAAAAVLGAPLGHDFATISLSDLHTDWDVIVRRVRAAAEADLVTVLYNPRSRRRVHQLPDALAIFAAHRPPSTPVAVVMEAEREGQAVIATTLEAFDPATVTMNSLVVVGSSTTRYVATEAGPRMITPRDYRWMER